MCEAPGLSWWRLTDFVPWALVIVGWLIINRQHNARETRKERRAAIDRLNAELDNIESLAVSFHSASSFEPDKLSTINRRLKRLMALVEATGMVREDDTSLTALVADVRRAITLKNVDKRGFKTQPRDGKLLNEVAAKIDELRDAVEDAFCRKYQ